MEAGTVLADQYRVDKVLGTGAFGQVWYGWDLVLERDVAVKVMLAEEPGPDLLKAFEREAKAAARLRHPRIVAVYNAGLHEGRWFIVMELLRGANLAQVMKENPAGLPVGRAVDLGIMLADGLAIAHEAGIVHRDLKPANLFVEPGDQLRICDFGIAHNDNSTSQRGHTPAAGGTPLYAPPELWNSDRAAAEPPADMYTVGGILYEMLTGNAPFAAAPSMAALIVQHLRAVPVPPRVLRPAISADLSDLVSRLLAKDPGDRPTARELWSALTVVRATLQRDEQAPPGTAHAAVDDGTEHGPTQPGAGSAATISLASYPPGTPASAPTSTAATGPKITFVPDAQPLEFIEHDDGLLSFSPDGRLLAVAGLSHIRFWATDRGFAGQPDLLASGVRGLTFTPDGQHLVASCGRPAHTIARWSLTRGASPGEMRTRADDQINVSSVGSATVSPDARLAAVLTGFGVRLWDIASGSAKPRTLRWGLGRLFTAPDGPNIGIAPAFSGDGSRLAAIVRSHVYVWDTGTGRQVAPPLKHPGGDEWREIYFSPDGRRIAVQSGRFNELTIYVWDVSSEQPALWCPGDQDGLDGNSAMLFSPDSRILAGIEGGGHYADKQVHLWDVTVSRALGRIPNSGSPTLSPDGTIMAVIWNGKIRLWDTTSLQRSPDPLADPAGNTREDLGGPALLGSDRISRVAFSPDWSLMATSLYRAKQPPVVRLWRARPA